MNIGERTMRSGKVFFRVFHCRRRSHAAVSSCIFKRWLFFWRKNWDQCTDTWMWFVFYDRSIFECADRVSESIRVSLICQNLVKESYQWWKNVEWRVRKESKSTLAYECELSSLALTENFFIIANVQPSQHTRFFFS